LTRIKFYISQDIHSDTPDASLDNTSESLLLPAPGDIFSVVKDNQAVGGIVVTRSFAYEHRAGGTHLTVTIAAKPLIAAQDLPVE
jgi:hypothetical protein